MPFAHANRYRCRSTFPRIVPVRRSSRAFLTSRAAKLRSGPKLSLTCLCLVIQSKISEVPRSETQSSQFLQLRSRNNALIIAAMDYGTGGKYASRGGKKGQVSSRGAIALHSVSGKSTRLLSFPRRNLDFSCAELTRGSLNSDEIARELSSFCASHDYFPSRIPALLLGPRLREARLLYEYLSKNFVDLYRLDYDGNQASILIATSIIFDKLHSASRSQDIKNVPSIISYHIILYIILYQYSVSIQYIYNCIILHRTPTSCKRREYYLSRVSDLY